MKKKTGGKNWLLAVVVAAIVGALIFMAVTRQTNTVQDVGTRLFEEVMALDLENEFPDDPIAVLEIYNKTDRLLSGNMPRDFSEEDLRAVIELQRLTLHPDLLAINPLESHIEGYKEKIAYLEKSELRLMQVNSETPRFSEDAQMCTIGVRQFWTGHVRVDLVFNLRIDSTDGKWRIVGWEVNSHNLPEEGQEG